MSRTIAQKNRPSEGMVKAGELIEIRQSATLTLHDRRVLNLLIENAGQSIAEDRSHCVPISLLRGPNHRGGERVADSITRLMTTLVEVPAKDGQGNKSTQRMTLLSDTTTTDDESNPTGEVTYSFSPAMRKVLAKSDYWGRIKGYVMFSFTSKYSLALYELLCLRINLQRSFEDFSIDDMRQRLGVADGKLDRAPDFLRRVIRPALEEINALSDFVVSVDLVRDGGMSRGKLTGFRVQWERKTPEAWASTLGELNQPKIGRRARIRGEVDQIGVLAYPRVTF